MAIPQATSIFALLSLVPGAWFPAAETTAFTLRARLKGIRPQGPHNHFVYRYTASLHLRGMLENVEASSLSCANCLPNNIRVLLPNNRAKDDRLSLQQPLPRALLISCHHRQTPVFRRKSCAKWDRALRTFFPVLFSPPS